METFDELPTPSLVVDADALDHNLRVMAEALPGTRLRPHVKATKCTALAHRQAALGHRGFTCATVREALGMAAAGLGEDLLLANEIVDRTRLAMLAAAVRAGARITVAVDSEATIDATADAGIAEILIDVNVGLPRCGCPPDRAGMLADHARRRGLTVRGVMGYEGHAMVVENRGERAAVCDASMAQLRRAHDDVGGDVISAGGTGTYDLNTLATDIQAGSYSLMDTAYAKLGLPFRRGLTVLATVVSVSADYAVADCGLKALGMDHGNPTIEDADVWLCSDEHVTFTPRRPVAVGEHVRVFPAHVDPTVAYHERMFLCSAGRVIDVWDVDLRGW